SFLHTFTSPPISPLFPYTTLFRSSVSRTTLREAIRILATNGVLNIQRGRGTFVHENFSVDETTASIQQLSDMPVNIRDLYEIRLDRKSTRLNSSHVSISYAVFCLN